MIFHNEKNKCVIMGSGNIGVRSGSQLIDNEIIGVMGFQELNKSLPIGSNFEPEVKGNLSNCPVILKFTNPESIDVVIRGLENAKESMLKAIESNSK